MKILLMFLLIGLVLVSGCTQQTSIQDNQIQQDEIIDNGNKYIDPNTSLVQKQNYLEIDFPELNPTKTLTHNGDLIISEGEYTINNTKMIFKGNLIVNGTGKLIVQNSILDFQQEYNNQYKISIGNSAEADLDNIHILTNQKWMYVEMTDTPKVKVKYYRGYDPNIPWWNIGWNSDVEIKDSLIGLSIHGNSTLEAENSNLFLELLFGNSTGTFNLPIGFVEDFNTNIENDIGTFRIKAKNSFLREWGTTVMHDSNITFVDSVITIGINMGANWPVYTSPKIKVSGLKAKKYDNFELPFDTNYLKLVNTEVTRWYPQAFGGAVLEIENSDLADLQWNGDDAKVIVKNSKMSIAFARNNVTYEIYNSQIDGDVTALDDSKIYLYNTQVRGKIQEIGNGKVFIDGQPF